MDHDLGRSPGESSSEWLACLDAVNQSELPHEHRFLWACLRIVAAEAIGREDKAAEPTP